MALPSAYNTDILATTINNWWKEKGAVDNIFGAHVLFYLLNKKRTFQSGGQFITVELMYAQNQSRGSYQGYDLLDISPQSILTAADYAWKQAYTTVSISGEEKLKNMGEAAMFNMLEKRLKNAELSLQSELVEQLYTDGSGNDGKDLVGLPLAIDSAGTYGGINRTNETWWSAREKAVSADVSIAELQKMYNLCGLGRPKGQPKVILTTVACYEGYENLLTDQKRFVNEDSMADAGFAGLKYKGAVMMEDEDCPSGQMYFINEDYMDFVTHSDRDFMATPMKSPINQDADVMQILWMGALVASNCRKLGKITGFTN